MIWTALQLVNWTTDYFKQKNLPGNQRLESEVLVAQVLGLDRINLYLQHDRPTSEEERAALRQLIRQRVQRVPLAYLTGVAHFWTLTLTVTPDVLIPRKETELLVESAVDLAKTWQQTNAPQKLNILELGTGSAAIAIVLAMEIDDSRILSIEKCPKAAVIANQNIQTYQPQFKSQLQLIVADHFVALQPEHNFSMLVSNPPYLSAKDLENLQAEVHHEPKLALDGGLNGLDFFMYLEQTAKLLLQDQGYLLLEHGYDQRSAILDIFKTDYKLVSQKQDYAQQDRLLIFQKC